MATTYCSDKDLQVYRPNILELGVESWDHQRQEAYSIVNRAIETRWYRVVAEGMGYDWRLTAFNPELVKEGELTRLEAYKTLELAYQYLKKEGEDPDGFERLEDEFRKRYGEELMEVLAAGIDYDWDGSGDVDFTETAIDAPRRQMRV